MVYKLFFFHLNNFYGFYCFQCKLKILPTCTGCFSETFKTKTSFVLWYIVGHFIIWPDRELL